MQKIYCISMVVVLYSSTGWSNK